jgi:hypothetical protein
MHLDLMSSREASQPSQMKVKTMGSQQRRRARGIEAGMAYKDPFCRKIFPFSIQVMHYIIVIVIQIFSSGGSNFGSMYIGMTFSIWLDVRMASSFSFGGLSLLNLNFYRWIILFRGILWYLVFSGTKQIHCLLKDHNRVLPH